MKVNSNNIIIVTNNCFNEFKSARFSGPDFTGYAVYFKLITPSGTFVFFVEFLCAGSKAGAFCGTTFRSTGQLNGSRVQHLLS